MTSGPDDSKPKEVVASFVYSMWAARKHSSHLYKVAKVTALNSYSHADPLASRQSSNNKVGNCKRFQNSYSNDFLIQKLPFFPTRCGSLEVVT
jgi:hypothetical protein